MALPFQEFISFNSVVASLAGLDPWGGIGLEVKECGAASVLSVIGNGGKDVASFAAAHFTDLPQHNAFRLTGTYVFLNSEATQKGAIFVDSKQVWTVTLDTAGDADPCSGGVDFEIFTAHTSAETKLDISGDRIGTGIFKPGFAVKNIKLELLTLGSDTWVKGEVDFSKGMDNWLGAGDLQVTTCDSPVGVILGGDNTQPVDSVTVKTYTNLPEHTALIIRFTFTFISWEGDYPALLSVDGTNIWSLPYSKVSINSFTADS